MATAMGRALTGLLLGVALGWLPAHAQVVRVRVLDWMTQAPIAGAEVELRRYIPTGIGNINLGESHARTDVNGEASFLEIPGHESISVSRDGYRNSCFGCPWMKKKLGDIRLHYLMPIQEVALLELREEYRMAAVHKADAKWRHEEMLQHFERAHFTFDLEAKRRHGVALAKTDRCLWDERAKWHICTPQAIAAPLPVDMGREEAELRRFCGFVPELAAATLDGMTQQKQLEKLQAYCLKG